MYLSKHTLLMFSAGFACCILLLLLFAAKGDFTTAAPPQVLSYHGNLTDTNGVPIQGVKTITFRLYGDATGGVPKWEETMPVTLVEGNFQVLFGENPNNPLPLPFEQSCWLGVTVEPSPELAPRQPLAAAPYSLHALSIADGAITSPKIAGGQVVKSINALKDDVTLAAGANITVNPSGNTLTITAATQIPSGGIIMWSGTNIPAGWALCDGTQGTPDLRDRFIVAAGGIYNPAATGGPDPRNPIHTHGPGSYKGPSHTHTGTTGDDNARNTHHGGAENQYQSTHIHQHPFTTNASGTDPITGTSGEASSLPPYYALAFIMKL